MPNFCVKCGSPLNGPFCVKCGAGVRGANPPAQPQSPVVTGAQQGIGPLGKLAIAAVVIVCIGGLAAVTGLYYVAHRVSQRVHQAEDGILGSSSESRAGDPGSTGSSAATGNVCRLLSKEDVGRAIGIEIIRADSADNGCSYIAKGAEADMLAKHATAMTASRGADKKTQQALQTFAGGMFKQFQSERPQSEQDKSGEVLVFNFSVDQQNAAEQMRLNSKGLSILGDMQGLPGVGDEAFASSDGMIMVRKGNNLLRIMYVTCPCGTEQVKPLAKKLADSL